MPGRRRRSAVWAVAVALVAPVVAAGQGSEQPVLLFGIGLHIEPQGVTAQGYRSGQGNYWDAQYFARHVQDIQKLAAIVERHGGRLTVQAQSPFTQVAIRDANPVLAELAARGHEMALHFHEDAHLGPDGESLPVDRWCAVMAEEMEYIRQAAGISTLRYWSGGNLYPGVFAAAACAGLSINSDWKNPHTQQIPEVVRSVHPWRPAGGTDGVDFSSFTTHDPNGPVIFLPEGAYDTSDYKSEDYLTVVGRALVASVAAATPDAVNVMHFTLHPGELRGDPADPFGEVDRFLTTHVDPYVAEGRVQWATFGEMADAYRAWEQTGTSRGRLRRRVGSTGGEASEGYITFAVNVHDWVHPDESAATLNRLVDIFERYGVRGDFYFTPEVVRVLLERHPEVVERLRRSAMTISYHVRPPHPLYAGFHAPLAGLAGEVLQVAIRDYETYKLDLKTGALDRSGPGGYRYVAQVFARAPVVASAPTDDPELRSAALGVYRELGARATVIYHESGTDPEQPFEFVQGLLVRPSDFSVTRVTVIDGSENFWWNYMGSTQADRYHPLRILEKSLANWNASAPSRLPFITALIHENNFVRPGAEAWSAYYYEMHNGQRGDPLPPPWDLDAPDPSQLRPEREQEAIWAAYEALVAYAAQHFQVVTSEDLLLLASAATP
ncbi:MAG: hypothetical protein HXY19_02050 [Thermoanaerobaculaceae bacterium]|nr:hypothetical protein [Thermoanaerobaculaceae bacterium]